MMKGYFAKLVFLGLFASICCKNDPCELAEENAHLPIEGDCEHFIICGCYVEEGRGKCQPNTYFDRTLGHCTSDVPAGCDITTTPGTGSCSSCNKEYLGKLVPVDGDCSKYCVCQFYDHQELNKIMPCPKGLHFNPILQVCDWPLTAGCKDALSRSFTYTIISTNRNVRARSCTTVSTIKPTTEKTTRSTTTAKPSTEKTTTSPTTAKTTTEKTTRSTTTAKPSTEKTTATPTTAKTTAQKTTPSSTTVKSTTVKTTATPTTAKSTTEKTTATPTTEKSTTPKAGSCSSCNKEYLGKLVPVDGDCTKYCVCQFYDHQELNKIMPCPGGTYFNPELQVCDWPLAAGCAYAP